MPGTPLASLQLGRVAWSSQQMPAFGPFADALEARCDGLLLLRIVRRLPVRAQRSNLAEPDGQALDNPQGRKPRGRAESLQERRWAMGI